MNTKGFTLTEVLITVIIVGVLVSVALPMYTKTIERSRATEAMSAIKAMNDSIYAFFSEREICPTKFSQLAVSVPAADLTGTTVDTKFFTFTLAGASVNVPGTDCKGILATRRNGGDYSYQIWNPYTRGTNGKAHSLACAPTNATGSDATKSQAICESLGLAQENN